MSPSRKYDGLDDEVAELIVELHNRHPNLGHHGLHQALEDEGVEVDPKELEGFMEAHHIEGEHWMHIPNSTRKHFKIARLVFPGNDVIQIGDDS
jgi:hypothetical protein